MQNVITSNAAKNRISELKARGRENQAKVAALIAEKNNPKTSLSRFAAINVEIEAAQADSQSIAAVIRDLMTKVIA